MYMFIVLAILLTAAAMFAVAYPILLRSNSSRPMAVSAQETLDELLAQRDAAFHALRELNFDHQVGKITDEDFVVFEAHLKQVAADALRALDGWEAEADDKLDRAIERAVRQRRATGGAVSRACSACGQLGKPEDKFCATCGAALPEPGAPQDGAACPACGLPHQEGDRFCAGCGAALGDAAGSIRDAEAALGSAT